MKDIGLSSVVNYVISQDCGYWISAWPWGMNNVLFIFALLAEIYL